ncbi:MAG: hypothetical protein WDZ62_02295 [Candidatus Pacearchaeota archaeon]
MVEQTLALQEKQNYCVCAVLQNIFIKYDIHLSQEDIAKSLTPSEKGFYVDDKNFYNFMNLVGLKYKYYFHNETPFNEPETLLEEMSNTNGFIGHHNHVYLLENFKDPIVKMVDPKDNRIISRNLEKLMLNLKSGRGFFGLVKRVE